jgi:hypothetical protein
MAARPYRANLGLDADAAVDQGLEALVVLSITLGLCLRERPKLAWDMAQRVRKDPDGLAQERR